MVGPVSIVTVATVTSAVGLWSCPPVVTLPLVPLFASLLATLATVGVAFRGPTRRDDLLPRA
jgi:hypothetical protein